MGPVMQWLVDHLPFAHRNHPAPAVREASHRLRNETMKLRSELTRSAGGPQNLELLIRRMKEDRDNA